MATAATGIRIELGTAGMPDQWIDVIDVGLKSARQTGRWQELSKKAQEGDETAAQALLSEMVTSWRVLDPETGKELPPPLEASLEDVPLRAAKMLLDHIQGQVDALRPKS